MQDHHLCSANNRTLVERRDDGGALEQEGEEGTLVGKPTLEGEEDTDNKGDGDLRE